MFRKTAGRYGLEKPAGRMKDESGHRREAHAWLKNTTLYQEYLAERDEILRHKWIESEKAGFDIGFDAALIDWVTNYRTGWRRARRQALAR